jgi:hypothetical protein
MRVPIGDDAVARSPAASSWKTVSNAGARQPAQRQQSTARAAATAFGQGNPKLKAL